MPERRCIQGFTRSVADFTLEATNCRILIADGSLTISAALHTRQQTLEYQWSKVGDKYFKVEDSYTELTVDDDRQPIPDGPQKTAYLNGREMYSDVLNKLQLKKNALELAASIIEPPAETNAQKAEKFLVE